jgi:hypothetical protein
MRTLFRFLTVILVATSGNTVMAQTRQLITGDSPEQVQENAYKKQMDYPVTPLKCNQRCHQWWARD